MEKAVISMTAKDDRPTKSGQDAERGRHELLLEIQHLRMENAQKNWKP
jgi:hypothetical protein